MNEKNPPLSETFQQALNFAAELHRGQIRKNNQIPYLSHLLGVTSLVLECGGTESEAAAALLHDAVEDQGGRETLLEIQHRFGEEIAAIVEGCTDAYTIPKPPWRARKEKYLHSLGSASPSVRLVSLADKVHNARSLHRDLLTCGESIWSEFKGGKEGTLWYYQSLTEILNTGNCPYLERELGRYVSWITELTEQRS
ncbi:MAG: HD domain-containing protein [Anaerolineales bacterium]|nr:HD domain-containing protein [Anaerolineales bacterium]